MKPVIAAALTLIAMNVFSQKTVVSKQAQQQRGNVDSVSFVLNVVSRIRYTTNWLKKEDRIMELQGEAYVDGSKNNFIVTTNRLIINCTHCIIDIADYDADSIARITVFSGEAVVYYKAGAAKRLKEGEVIEARNGKLIPAGEYNINQDTGWINGNLYFNMRSISDVINYLNRYFAYDIIVPNNLHPLSQTITGLIIKETEIETILTSLLKQAYSDFTVKRKGNKIKIIPK